MPGPFEARLRGRAILVEDGLATSASKASVWSSNAVRSSVARRLGLPAAGFRSAPRDVDGLIDLLPDADARLRRVADER